MSPFQHGHVPPVIFNSQLQRLRAGCHRQATSRWGRARQKRRARNIVFISLCNGVIWYLEILGCEHSEHCQSMEFLEVIIPKVDCTVIELLNARKFKVALNLLRRNFLNFGKSCILSCWLHFDNKKWGSSSSFLSYKRLKLKLRVCLAGHIVAMVTYCATKFTATCSPIFGQFVDTMILASTGIEWL